MPFPSGTWILQISDSATRAELEQFYALLQGYLSKQHKDDGSHASITADDLTLVADDETGATGDLTADGDGTFDGTVTADADGTPIELAPDDTFGPGVRMTSGSTSSWRWEGSPSAATITLRDLLRTASHSDTGTIAIIRTASGATGDYVIRPHASYITLNLGTDGSGQRINEVNAVTLRAFSNIFERARTTAVGEWIAVTHAGGNFTGDGSMTWTVESGDQTTFAYTLVGKTMTVAFYLVNTSIGGTLSNAIRIAIPGSFTAARSVGNALGILIDNGTRTTGFVQVAATGTTINISRTDAANFTASTDNTAVVGQITFEVQ